MAGLEKAVRINKRLMREGGKGLPPYAHVGATLVQPGTGAILAVYGGPGWSSNMKRCDRVKCEYNMAEAPEPVGSSFKPYVLATAVQQNMNVQNSILNGFAPLFIPPQGSVASRAELSSRTQPADDIGWTHFNEPSENTGPLTVAKAAAISSDPAFEDLAHRVGVDEIMTMAKDFGVGQNPFNANGGNDLKGLYSLYGSHGMTPGSLQIALGGGPLTTVEQAATFATLAADGQYATPHIVARIIDPAGGMLPSKVVRSHPLTATQAADVDYALSFDNQPTYPGATAWPNAAWDTRKVIAKTGTLGNGDFASEAWFNGSIPQYSLSVALFTDSQKQNIDGLGGIAGGFGGTWPAKIWDTFMTTQFASLPVAQLPTPDYTGFSKWNQVGNLPKKHKKHPHPHPSHNPHPNPSCTPSPGTSCPPSGGSPTPPPPSSAPPSSPPPSGSPSPSCTVGPFGQCPSSSPSTSPGRGNNLATFDATQQPAEEASSSSGVATVVKAVTAVLAALF
jgi:membrane peptidoglycan carboxypeptidase